MPTSEVQNMNCMEGMKQYPDKFFDLAICDIQYNIGASKPSKKPEFVKQKNGTYLKVNSPNYKPKEWDSVKMESDYFEELKRVSKNQIVFWCKLLFRITWWNACLGQTKWTFRPVRL